ncbi:MAG: LytR/AlgR family response regulator transcription factor, partial [Kordiimonas sp.]
DFEVCGQADNGHDTLLLSSKLQPDVIFLDIQMPGMDGMAAAEELKARSGAVVVFVTAYDEHALEAFRVNALDYLVKPVNDEQFAETLKRIKKRVTIKRVMAHTTQTPSEENTYLKRLGIKDGKTISMVDVARIEYIESAVDYLCIFANGETHIQRQTLKAQLDLLNPEQFIRIHRSHAINLKYLQSLEEDENGLVAVMSSGHKLSVSRRFQKFVKQQITSKV